MSICLIHPNDQKSVYGDTIKYVACEPPYWLGLIAQYCNSLSESLIHYSCAFQSSHLSNPPIFQTFSNLTLDKSSKICGRFAAN